MDNLTTKAFELGMSGFMLLIVLILVVILVGRTYNSFAKIPDKLDSLTDKIAESNKELSNQLVKTSIIQENILSIMKETMISINNNTVKMAIIENKLDEVNFKLDEVKKIAENNVAKLKTAIENKKDAS